MSHGEATSMTPGAESTNLGRAVSKLIDFFTPLSEKEKQDAGIVPRK